MCQQQTKPAHIGLPLVLSCLRGHRYLISQHPEVEARIVMELRSLDLLATPERPHVRDLEYEDLGKLHYLSCAIKVSSDVSLHIMLAQPSACMWAQG